MSKLAIAMATIADVKSSAELSQDARASPKPRWSAKALSRSGATPIRNIRGTSPAISAAKNPISTPATRLFWLAAPLPLVRNPISPTGRDVGLLVYPLVVSVDLIVE